MREKIIRGLGSLIVFLAVYFLADFVIGAPSYDAYLKAIAYLASVIGAGCYWIGSRA